MTTLKLEMLPLSDAEKIRVLTFEREMYANYVYAMLEAAGWDPKKTLDWCGVLNSAIESLREMRRTPTLPPS